MDPTTEMRWWWAGDPPEEVIAWFLGLRGTARHEVRVDRYLLTGDLDVNIKIRAGDRIEIKTLAARSPGHRVADGVVGTLEQWTKWHVPLTTDWLDNLDLDQHRQTWVRVSKRRQVIEVEGCQVELATVDVGPERRWTLAAETDRANTTGRNRLAAAVRWLVAATPPPSLDLADDRSYSYVELLHVRRTDDQG